MIKRLATISVVPAAIIAFAIIVGVFSFSVTWASIALSAVLLAGCLTLTAPDISWAGKHTYAPGGARDHPRSLRLSVTSPWKAATGISIATIVVLACIFVGAIEGSFMVTAAMIALVATILFFVGFSGTTFRLPAITIVHGVYGWAMAVMWGFATAITHTRATLTAAISSSIFILGVKQSGSLYRVGQPHRPRALSASGP
jgi:hypothetical protein